MKNTVKVMFMSLIASLLLLFSCSLAPQDTGDITLRLPTSRAATNDAFTITLINSSGKEDVHNFKSKDLVQLDDKTSKVTIDKILIGQYTVKFYGTINNVLYEGETTTVVKPGNNNSCSIQLSKVKTEEDLPYIVLSIDLEPREEIIISQNDSYRPLRPTITGIKDMPKDSYTLTYRWLVRPVTSQDYEVIPNEIGPEFNIRTSEVGRFSYKCEVTIKVADEYKDKYKNGPIVTSESNTVIVTVKEGTLPPNPEPENPDATLETIYAIPKENIHALYGSTVRNSIQEFDSLSFLNITERYSDGTTKDVTDYTNYKLEANDTLYNSKIENLNDVNIKVIYKPSNIFAVASIPVKFKLETPIVNISPSEVIDVNKGDTYSPFTASLANQPSAIPDSYALSYQWYQQDLERGFVEIPNATSSEYKPSDSEIGTKVFKCKVTAKATKDFERKCINPTVESYSSELRFILKDQTSPKLESIVATKKWPEEPIRYNSSTSNLDYFQIVEQYSDSSKVRVEGDNIKNYRLEGIGDTYNKLGVQTVTIVNIANPAIKSSAQYECKFDLATITSVSVSNNTINLKLNESKTITASYILNNTDMPEGEYKVTYKLMDASSGATINTFTTNKITIPSSPTEVTTKYKVQAVIEPVNPDFCTGIESTGLSDEITVNVIDVKYPTDITVTLKNPDSPNNYVVFAEKPDINLFNIVEKYADGSTKTGVYSNYSITPEKISDNDFAPAPNNDKIKCTITHNTKKNLSKTINVPCRYKVGNSKITLNKEGPIEMELNAPQNVQLIATFVSGMPNKSFNITKCEWHKGTEVTTNTYDQSNQPSTFSYTIPTNVEGSFEVYSVLTIEPLNTAHVLDDVRTVTSPKVQVTVNSKSDGSDQNFGTTQELVNLLSNSSWKSVVLSKSYIVDKEIALSPGCTIKASEPITIKRADGFKGSMFIVNKESANIGSSDSARITIDGGSTTTPVASMIKVENTTTATITKCTLQNNYGSCSDTNDKGNTLKGGGAIFSRGTIKIENCDLKNNKTDGNGGAIFVGDGSMNSITNSTITNNESLANGGAIAINNTNTTLDLNNDTTHTISSNKADGKGGAIYMEGGIFKLTSGTINNNTASQGLNAYVTTINSSTTSFNGVTVSSPTPYNQEIKK